VGELTDLFRSVSKYYRTIRPEDISVSLVEAGKKLLPDLPPRMGEYTTEHLRKQGVLLEIGDGVALVDENGITLQSGRRLETATVIWSAGVRPAPAVLDLPVDHARNGGIFTERDMQLRGRPGVWALGDCAWIPTAKADSWYPPTAQHAIREGPALADNVIATLRGQPTTPFDFTALGTMASLGGRRGVCAFPNGFILTGFLAWVLWRTYYLARLPGIDRRLRVTVDWSLDLFFPRDIAEFRVYTERSHQMAAVAAGHVPK
jgi:NADH dehydrogenase